MPKHMPSFTTHLEQYVYASNYVMRKDVLDIGSGEGYGPQILSYGANKIDVIDKSPRSLMRAKAKNYYCPVEFHEMDLEEQFLLGSWDVIVALQILEHLNDPETVVELCRTYLREGGILIFGLPHMMPAEDHKRLYKAKDVLNLFKDFSDIDLHIHDRKIISRDQHYRGIKSYVGIAYK